MNIDIDWGTKEITIPKAELVLVQTTPIEIYNLDLNLFRLALKDKEDDTEGMTFLDTHQNNGEVLLGGIVYARVVEIINGYSITFEDGQYAVNLLGANSNVGDVVNPNQVSVRSSNSAGLISNQAIEFSSFNGGVTIDANNSTGRASSGVNFPSGTLQQPVDNLDDLYLIAATRGFNKVYILGDLNLNDTQAWSAFQFEGESILKTLVTVDPTANTENCEFMQCSIQGELDGNSQIESSCITDLNFVDGFIYKCSIGPNTIKLGTSVSANIFSCYSTVLGESTPFIDMNQTGTLALRDYNGGITLKNYSGSSSHSIDLASGQIILENTITSGTFVVRGVGKLIDTAGNHLKSGNWNGGVTIINELINNDSVSGSVWDAPLINHTNPGTTGESLFDASNGGVNLTLLAEAIWDQLNSANTEPGSVGVLLSELQLKLDELHKLQGLDASNPMTVTPTSRVSGSINLTLSGDGETSTTVSRN
mgnify:CR=1 FL=1